MRKRTTVFLLILLTAFYITACRKKDSTFSIQFIDVGQGDAALVECDGRYMLIDGGDKSHGQKVFDVLKSHDVAELDILAISHLHEDHYAGLTTALKALTRSKIGLTICNKEEDGKKSFNDLVHELSICDTRITTPKKEEYPLGSATVKVIDKHAEEENDSLVLLITYGQTSFLFTGDIGKNRQKELSDYENIENKKDKVTLMKMPHHGAEVEYAFMDTYLPDYVIISVGDNAYGHPDKSTLEMLDSKTYKPKLYRTDKCGDITVISDGKDLKIETSK